MMILEVFLNHTQKGIVEIISDETESIKSFEHKKNASEVQRSNARIGVLTYLRSLLDTLEVKEVQEEPVSEDFRKAAEQDVCEVINICSASGIPNDHIPSWVQDAMINEFIHGAKWKEQQFEKERLKHCDALTEEQAQMESDFVVDFIKKNNSTPTFIDAIEYGKKLKLKDKK